MKPPSRCATDDGHRLFCLVLLNLGSCAQSPANLPNVADRELIIRAVLANVMSDYPGSKISLCVQSKSSEDAKIELRQIAYVPPRVLPPRLPLCSGSSTGGFISLEEPQIRGKIADVSVAFHCGDLCGFGTDYLLERAADDWKVIKRSRSWIS